MASFRRGKPPLNTKSARCTIHTKHTPRGTPSPGPSQLNKATQQREYREREEKCFNTLRNVIKKLTGEELRTRQEILRKAIDILLTASETSKQDEAPADTLTPYKTFTPTPPEDTTAAHTGYFTQSPRCPQNWQSTSAEIEAALPCYAAYVQDQQYYFMSSTDPAFDPASSPGYYGGDPSGCCQF